jgi:hypothetical protein
LNRYSLLLRAAYLELLDSVPFENYMNIDETPLSIMRKQGYLWGFCCREFTVFATGTRSMSMLDKVVGSENGVKKTITSDMYPGYISYAKMNPDVKQQGCLTHLKRDFKHCYQYLNKEVS